MFSNLRTWQRYLLLVSLCPAGCTAIQDDLFLLHDNSGPSNPPQVIGGAGGTAGNGGAGQAARGAAAGSAGVAGTPNVTPGLDPSVTFQWTSTVQGAGACRAARFTGNFSCALDSLLPESLEGSLNIVLTGSSETQLLPMEGAQILVFDRNTRLVLFANVNGQLDCSKQLLTGAIVPTPSEVLQFERTITWPVTMLQPTVTGTLEGNLDQAMQTIDGKITLQFDPTPKCQGTFRVRATP